MRANPAEVQMEVYCCSCSYSTDLISSPGVVCHVGEPFSHLGTSSCLSLLPFLSAFSDSVSKLACLPGLVLNRQQQGSGLWPLNPMVCYLHPLCLPLLVPTHL